MKCCNNYIINFSVEIILFIQYVHKVPGEYTVKKLAIVAVNSVIQLVGRVNVHQAGLVAGE